MPLFFPSPEIQLVKTTAVTKKKKKKEMPDVKGHPWEVVSGVKKLLLSFG